MSTAKYWTRCLAFDCPVFALAVAGLIFNISAALDVFVFVNWFLVVVLFMAFWASKPPNFEPRKPGGGIYHWATEMLTVAILVLSGHPITASMRLIAAFMLEAMRDKQEKSGAA